MQGFSAAPVGEGPLTEVPAAGLRRIRRWGLPIANAIGQGETFWIFGAISLAGLLFVGRFVPETKARDYEQVDADLQSRFGRRPAPSSSTR